MYLQPMASEVNLAPNTDALYTESTAAEGHNRRSA